jgi:hypothetical protein
MEHIHYIQLELAPCSEHNDELKLISVLSFAFALNHLYSFFAIVIIPCSKAGIGHKLFSSSAVIKIFFF